MLDKDNQVLVVKVNAHISQEDYKKLAVSLCAQMKLGLVLLPVYCDAIIAPKDIEVKIENPSFANSDLMNEALKKAAEASERKEWGKFE